ncbi:cortex morphogenetic protein CmpA [Paenibacillus sp. R14(2021)]|nr:cortex morphogenetic protein CmpA [Paenibacillus sp. R14(2021)]
MPQWLCNQLMRAFLKKDRRQIRLLNDCWYFYRTSQHADEDSASL